MKLGQQADQFDDYSRKMGINNGATMKIAPKQLTAKRSSLRMASEAITPEPEFEKEFPNPHPYPSSSVNDSVTSATSGSKYQPVRRLNPPGVGNYSPDIRKTKGNAALQSAINAANDAVGAALGDNNMNSSFYSKMSAKDRSQAYASVQCPACDRTFNDKAAERHIPMCQQRVAEGKRPISSRGNIPSATGSRKSNYNSTAKSPNLNSRTSGRKMIGVNNSVMDVSGGNVIDRSQY